MPIICTQGQIPDQLAKTFTSLRTLLARCAVLIEQGDALLVKVSKERKQSSPKKIEEAMKTISENCDDISKVIADYGLRGQKVSQVFKSWKRE